MSAVCACLWSLTAATPPPGHVKQPDTDQHPPRYEFGYDVRDGYGGSQGHLETRDGEYALGKYYVNLPRNEQKVDYFADDWGYHPLVEYKTSSASSSMSTQFALGEKAVAALAKQYGVAPPLEILKTKVAQSLVAGPGPQVSIQGASGVIPGPSDEPVHNSIESESYSSTSTPTPPVSSFPHISNSGVPHENTAGVNVNLNSGGVEVSTLSPSTHAVPLDRGTVSTEKYLSSGVGNYDLSLESYNSRKQSSAYQSENSESTGYSTTENYPVSFVRPDGSTSGENLSPQQYTLNYPRGSYETEEYNVGSSSASSNNAVNKEANYYDGSRINSSPQVSYNVGQGSLNEQDTQHEVSTYLADSNAAVDVSNNAVSRRFPGINEESGSPNTYISAILVGEKGNQYEENEIRHGYSPYSSTTTPRPYKTILKPIVVSEGSGYGAPLALYSAHSTSTEAHRKTKGKLYHREGRVKSVEESHTGGSGGYSTSSSSSNGLTNLLQDDEKEYYSTVAPTLEPVLVTPRLEPSRLTSSGNILAPIQAGVSISTQEHKGEDCDEDAVSGYSQEKTPNSEPDIEKQVIREEAVYKTTVDIQKSIPFEIHPDEDGSKQVTEQGSQEQYQSSDGNLGKYQENSNIEYNEGGNVEYTQNQSNEQYSVTEENSNGDTQPHYEAYAAHQAVSSPQQEYRSPELSVRPQFQYSTEANSNNYKQNNFLQNVVYAYHRMANGHNKQYVPGYPINVPVLNQPLFVPNRLYYVYLQRYNPFHNRYGSQRQLYTNYRPPVTPAPVHQSATPPYVFDNYHSQAGLQDGGPQTVPLFTPGYNRETGYTSGSNGYASNGGEQQSGSYESTVQTNSVANSDYSSEKNHFYGSGYSAQNTNTENVHNQENLSDNNLSTPKPYSEDDKYESEQAAQEYAAQLNALGSTIRAASAALKTSVHPDNQHVQYSTGPDDERRPSENYHQEENSDHQEKYVQESSNAVHHSANVLVKEVPVPQYVERTKLVEVEKPVHIPHPVPVEYTKIIEKHVPVVHPVAVHHTQFVEKPVPVPHPVPVEVTRIVEKHVPVPQPVPVEYTRVVAVEKPVPVPHPVPYAVTKLVAVDRPVAYPHPVPVPYAVPHPVGIPVPHLVPYPHAVPVPVKDIRPVYIYRKSTGGRLLHREAQVKNFRPSQPVFTSQYPPQTYEVTTYFKAPHAKNRGHGRKLCIEYGGFKPPMIPSVQVDDEHKPSYGPSAEDKS